MDRRQFLAGITPLVGSAMLSSPLAAWASNKKWKVGSVSPVGVSWNSFTEYFSKAITEHTKGQIRATNFPAMQLGNNTELVQNVRLGTVEAACVGVPQLSNFVSSFSAFQLPFLFRDFNDIETFFSSEYMKDRLAEVEPLGMKGLAWVATPGRGPLVKAKFVRVPGDVKGLKIRVAGNHLVENALRALGASPVSVAFGEVYTALQSGVIDAVAFERLTIASYRFYEVAKYYTDANMYPFPGLLAMNLRLWSSLSSEQKEIVKRAAEDAQAFYWDAAKKEDERLKGVCAKAGMKTITVDVTPFRAQTAGLYDKYMKTDKKIFEMVTEARRLQKV